MNIEPAAIHQVRRARDGRMVLIDDDAGSIAAQLREIDPSLRLRQSDTTGHYVVYQDVDGVERLVFTARHLDGRIVREMQRIADHRYDLLAEMDRIDRTADRDADHHLSEQTGEVGERLHHALRKDLGFKSRVYVP